MRVKDFQINLAAISTAIVTSFAYFNSAQAATFGEQEIDQSNIIAVAAPVGEELYNLLVIEQIPGQRQCWSESGSQPVSVEPLLLNFDFSQSCRRNTDSNGYSIRIEGQDHSLDYLLRIVKRNGELHLVGTPVANSEQSEVVIGRTHGLGDSFLKIFLDPGWKLTKRTYEDKPLGHVYFSGTSTAVASSHRSEDEMLLRDSVTEPDLAFSAPSPGRSPAQTASPLFKSRSPITPSDEGVPIPVPSPTDTLPSLLDEDSNSSAQGSAISSNRPLPPPPAPRSLPSSVEPTETDSVSIPVSAPDVAASTPPAPPAPNSRRSLSEIIAVAPRVPNRNGQTAVSNKIPVPEPPTSSNVEAPSQPLFSAAGKYKVVVKASNDQEQIHFLYPEAFSTTYEGQRVMQIGVFSSRDNADKVLQRLEENGLSGILIPL